MTLSCKSFLAVALAFSALALAMTANPVAAQPKKGAPITAAPQAPTIAIPKPSGVQRGVPVELNLTGTNLADPVGVWTSFPAKATIPTDMNNGKDATKLRIKLDVPADAPIGFHTLRIATKLGVSNAQVFCIDELPQIPEVETNHTKLAAQPIPVPCVVMGRTDAETSDFFKISVKEGQRLTFEVLGRRLGSGFDPILQLYDGRTGREMPGLYYSDDAAGLQSDARLTYAFAKSGDVFVEVRDTTHRGGADFNYRLRIGDFPAALAAMPVALKRGTKAQVSFTGSAVEGVAPVEVAAPADPTKSVVYVAPKGPSGLSGWPVPVFLSDIDEIAETEPNNDIAKANKLPVPGGVTGRFLEKGDIDLFSFPAKKGTKYTIAAETYEINSPAEVYLILKNAKNAELGKSVPTNPTARIEYTATEDGDLFIHAEHLNYVHGPNEVYHLTVKTAGPDFDVNLGIDRFDAAPGGTTLIPVTGVIRRDYTGPIELTVVGHPGLSGTVLIPPGVPPAAPPPAPGQIIAYLPLTAKADVPIGAYSIHVQAKGSVNGTEVIRYAGVGDLVKQSMANLAFPPREMSMALSVGVTDKPKFVLAAKPPVPEVIRGTPANLTIIADRSMGFADEIGLAATNLPANVTVTIKPIAKGTNEIPVQITAAAAAVPGPMMLVFRGTAKVGGKDFAYYSAPVPLVIQAEKKGDKKDEKPKDKPKDKK